LVFVVMGEGGYFEERWSAEILRVDRRTVVKWVKEGKVGATGLPSGRYRFPKSEMRKIFEGRSD